MEKTKTHHRVPNGNEVAPVLGAVYNPWIMERWIPRPGDDPKPKEKT
jgi:hypothetical protein